MQTRNLPQHTMKVHNAPVELVTYDEVLAANIRAARARIGLSQDLTAARMRSLGYGEWRYQTVGKVEHGKRRLTTAEIMALGWVLETSIFTLLKPPDELGHIRFPSGALIPARSVALSASAYNDQAVTWDGDEPRFAEDSGDVSARIIVTPRFPVPPRSEQE
jgi:hypothetical protein